MTVIVYRFIRAIKPSIQNQEEDFVFTAEEDADWEEKTLTRLKTTHNQPLSHISK
jgi:hypothetical protein